MSGLRKGLYIVGAKRTAFGTFGGKLRNHSATDLCVEASRAAVQHAAVEPQSIDHVIVGNVIQSSTDAAYLARHVGLRIGIPVPTPALTLNRLCGSGFQSIVSAAQEILAGDARVVLAAGTESMSQAPFAVRGVRFGTTLGRPIEFEDTLWAGLTDQGIKTPMGITAETLGAKYGVSREEADAFAHASQTRWRLANNAGHFRAEISPIKIKGKKGAFDSFEVDEHPRETDPEGLAKLGPVFKKDGLVTAGNASGICDGASAVVVASEEAVKELHLKPLARLLGWSVVGVEPEIMGIGPAPAIRRLCEATGVDLADVDLVEVNEAFAAQAVAVRKDLGVDPDRLNVNGGAIALGHPLGASGNRIAAHLTHELRRRGAKYGIGSACIGGGQGIAILLQSCQ